MRLKADKKGYFNCEGECGFKSKKVSHLILFKNQFLCWRCRNKNSIGLCQTCIINPADSTLNRLTRLPEGVHMKREKKIRKVINKTDLPESSDKVFWIGLTQQEHKKIWYDLYNQGLSHKEIDKQIENIKSQIKKSHEEYKNGRKTKSTFNIEFSKLIGSNKYGIK